MCGDCILVVGCVVVAFCWLVGWLCGCVVVAFCWLVGWLVGWLLVVWWLHFVGWLFGCVVVAFCCCWLVVWLHFVVVGGSSKFTDTQVQFKSLKGNNKQTNKPTKWTTHTHTQTYPCVVLQVFRPNLPDFRHCQHRHRPSRPPRRHHRRPLPE